MMAKNDNSASASAAKPTQAGNSGVSSNMTMVIGGIIIVIIVAVVLVFLLGRSPNATTTTTTGVLGNNTLSTAVTTVPPTITILPASPASTNVSKLFITKGQVSSLLGSGGSYGAYQRTTPTQLKYAYPPAFDAYNITAEYNMTYNATNPLPNNLSSGNILTEVVFATMQPKGLYSYVLAQYPYLNASLLRAQGANVINVSINQTAANLTYSASSFYVLTRVPASGASANTLANTVSNKVIFQALLGYTNSSVVVLSLLQFNGTAAINATRLAQYTALNLG